MLPIGDDNGQGGPLPLANWAFIALNLLAFMVELAQPSGALQSRRVHSIRDDDSDFRVQTPGCDGFRDRDEV